MPEAERIIPTAQHEPTDIRPTFIWGAVALCSGMLLGCALLVLWLYPTSRLDRTIRMPLPLYPEPRLQPDPEEDQQRFHSEEMHILNTAGWVDKDRGVVHIPIARAMQDVAREGVAGWPADREAPP
jgi:hypothetical protein